MVVQFTLSYLPSPISVKPVVVNMKWVNVHDLDSVILCIWNQFHVNFDGNFEMFILNIRTGYTKLFQFTNRYLYSRRRGRSSRSRSKSPRARPRDRSRDRRRSRSRDRERRDRSENRKGRYWLDHPKQKCMNEITDMSSIKRKKL